jgi:hypothetical protein
MTRKPLRLLVLAVTLAALMTAASAPAVSAHRPTHPRVVEAAKCLHGGYLDYTRADGRPFKNVTHCVVYALLGGKLKPVPTGTPDLTLSPGEFVQIGGTGARVYNYNQNFDAGWTTTFTVTNSGTGPSSQLLPFSPGGAQFGIANDTCTGTAIPAGGGCTFDLTFTPPAGCVPPEAYIAVVAIYGSSPYIDLVAAGFCPTD